THRAKGNLLTGSPNHRLELRQADVELAPQARLRLHPHPAPVSSYNGPYNGQSQPFPLNLLRGEPVKELENFRLQTLGNPNAVVLNTVYTVTAIHPPGDTNPARTFSGTIFDGIAQKIEKKLNNLIVIPLACREPLNRDIGLVF